MKEKTHPMPSGQRTDRARRLRHDAPFPERLLWRLLRMRRMGGLKFRRQFPIGTFYADFCCAEARLVVELDGMTHVGTGGKDDARTRELERMGYRVIRITDDDALQQPEAVADMILRAAVNFRKLPSPTPSGGKMGGQVSREKTGDPARPDVPSPQPSPRGRGGGR